MRVLGDLLYEAVHLLYGESARRGVACVMGSCVACVASRGCGVGVPMGSCCTGSGGRVVRLVRGSAVAPSVSGVALELGAGSWM